MSPQLFSVSICHKVLTDIFQNKNLDFHRLYLFLCRNQRKNFKCSRQHMHNFCSLIPLEATLAIQLDQAKPSLYPNFSVWTYPRLHPYSQLRITICTLQDSQVHHMTQEDAGEWCWSAHWVMGLPVNQHLWLKTKQKQLRNIILMGLFPHRLPAWIILC